MQIEKPATKKARLNGCTCVHAPRGFDWSLSIFGYYVELVDFSFVSQTARANRIFEKAKFCPMHYGELVE